MNYQTFDGFYAKAPALRRVFDQRFANPLKASAERFVWDYWHLPGEYTHLRTPAFHYFPRPLYDHFHRFLVRFGREKLGCHDISPPWLSCYIEGCRQEAHQDVPHGPLAFVYSLTNWKKRSFSGGETFLLKPRTRIEPEFNRLTIFNPALTHGVRELRGTHDPREGRLVIHGWFVNPRPFWVGPLSAPEIKDGLDNRLSTLSMDKLSSGFASFRIRIRASGRVTSIVPLIDTFATTAPLKRLLSDLSELHFPRAKGPTTLTFPVRIE